MCEHCCLVLHCVFLVLRCILSVVHSAARVGHLETGSGLPITCAARL